MSSFRRFERTQTAQINFLIEVHTSSSPHFALHNMSTFRLLASRHKSQGLSRLLGRVAGLTTGKGELSYLEETKQISWKATAMELQQHLTARTVESPMKCHKSKAKYRTRMLTFYSLPVTWCTTSLTFNKCTLCPHCIYVFCIYLRTNSDLCHLQLKLIGFYSRDEKCLQRGTDWVFK